MFHAVCTLPVFYLFCFHLADLFKFKFRLYSNLPPDTLIKFRSIFLFKQKHTYVMY